MKRRSAWVRTLKNATRRLPLSSATMRAQKIGDGTGTSEKKGAEPGVYAVNSGKIIGMGRPSEKRHLEGVKTHY